MATTARISEATREKVRKAWPSILDALAEGSPVSAAIKEHGISYGVVSAFIASEPGARNEWETAKEVSAEVLFDDLLKITATRFADIDPTRARAVMDSLKWLAAKRNPKVYSDRSQVDLNVKTIDLTRIIQEADARLRAGRQALHATRTEEATDPTGPLRLVNRGADSDHARARALGAAVLSPTEMPGLDG
jgi:hypothetical protein